MITLPRALAVRAARPALLLLLLLLLAARITPAQPARTPVEITVTPDHPGWTYHVGEPARFGVAVLRSGHPVPGVSVRYEAGPELMPPAASGPLALADGRAT